MGHPLAANALTALGVVKGSPEDIPFKQHTHNVDLRFSKARVLTFCVLCFLTVRLRSDPCEHNAAGILADDNNITQV